MYTRRMKVTAEKDFHFKSPLELNAWKVCYIIEISNIELLAMIP